MSLRQVIHDVLDNTEQDHVVTKVAVESLTDEIMAAVRDESAGRWEYALRTFDEEGDVDQIDDGSSYYEPRSPYLTLESLKDSHLYPEGEAVRRWVPNDEPWEKVPE